MWTLSKRKHLTPLAVFTAATLSIVLIEGTQAADCNGSPAEWRITGPGSILVDRSLSARNLPEKRADVFNGIQLSRTPRKFASSVDFRFRDIRGQKGCFQLSSVHVIVKTEEPYILQLARELQPGTCVYDVIYNHEYLHARVLSATIDKIVADARAAAAKGTVPSVKKIRNAKSARKFFNGQISKLMNGAIKKHKADAARSHKRIDYKTAKAAEQRNCSKADWDRLMKKFGK